MKLCIFNPEHDLCLAKGRWNYVPPRSAVEFALRDASLMQVLYPDAVCMSAYDPQLPSVLSSMSKGQVHTSAVIAWGWDSVVKHRLLKCGCPEVLLPSDANVDSIRELQHRSTVLSIQSDCQEIYCVEDMEKLFHSREHWVMKAPWSGAGRGLRWVHGGLSTIDRNWIVKTVREQRCVIAEPRRDVEYNVALEYMSGSFFGYSLFKTGNGVYKENVMWTDEMIASHFSHTDLQAQKEHVEQWLADRVWPHYQGPLGVDLMVCADGSVHVAEMNVRHTMGMVAHERLRVVG